MDQNVLNRFFYFSSRSTFDLALSKLEVVSWTKTQYKGHFEIPNQAKTFALNVWWISKIFFPVSNCLFFPRHYSLSNCSLIVYSSYFDGYFIHVVSLWNNLDWKSRSFFKNNASNHMVLFRTFILDVTAIHILEVWV